MVRAARAATTAGSLARCALSRVMTKPGHTELQHTPDRAHASDCERVNDARPPFDAPYPPLLANARWACCEVTLMIRPNPRAAIAGPNHWPSRNGAVRLTAMVRSQSCTVNDANGGRMLTPAQLTRMSTGPNAASASEAARETSERTARSALTQAAEPPPASIPAVASARRDSSRATRTTCAPARAS